MGQHVCDTRHARQEPVAVAEEGIAVAQIRRDG